MLTAVQMTQDEVSCGSTMSACSLTELDPYGNIYLLQRLVLRDNVPWTIHISIHILIRGTFIVDYLFKDM